MTADLMPAKIKPMLACPSEPFDDDEFFFEPKWDGIRCIAFFDGTLRLQSRRTQDITAAFPELVRSAPPLPAARWVVDGELVVMGADAAPDFRAVQSRLLAGSRRVGEAARMRPAQLMVFDLLYYEGRSLLNEPLSLRRTILAEAWRAAPRMHLTPAVAGAGKAVFGAALQHGLEGMVGKRIRSPYRPGKRSRDWRKVRAAQEGVFTVIGYTLGQGGELASLLLAECGANGVERSFAGRVAAQLPVSERSSLLDRLRELATSRPQAEGIGRSENARWTLPQLHVRVRYQEKTPAGRLRHPVLLGPARFPDPGGAL